MKKEKLKEDGLEDSLDAASVNEQDYDQLYAEYYESCSDEGTSMHGSTRG